MSSGVSGERERVALMKICDHRSHRPLRSRGTLMCEGLTGIAPRAAGAHRVTSLTSRGFERRRGAHLWREVSIPGPLGEQGTGYMV